MLNFSNKLQYGVFSFPNMEGTLQVGIKVWFLLEIIERQWQRIYRRENNKNFKKEDKKAKVKKSNKSRLNSLLLL